MLRHLPGVWRWEDRGKRGWWRVHDHLAIDDGPHFTFPAAPPLTLLSMDVSTFTVADARDYIATVRWQFAKSMPNVPHEYTVRQWEPDLEERFNAFVQLIRRDGELRYWPFVGRRREVKPNLAIDGFEYWTVGDPIGICQVINRAVLPADPHPGAIPIDELDVARRMDAQRGRRVRLISHGPGARRRPGPGKRAAAYDDELRSGIEGTVMMLDTLGQVHVRWDDRSRTALRPGVDEWEWLS